MPRLKLAAGDGMNNTFGRAALWLLEKGKISQDQYCRLAIPQSREAISNLALALWKAGRISAAEHDRLTRALDPDEADKAKQNLRAKFREAERYVASEKGSPVAQAGLPSLGKRRP